MSKGNPTSSLAKRQSQRRKLSSSQPLTKASSPVSEHSSATKSFDSFVEKEESTMAVELAIEELKTQIKAQLETMATKDDIKQYRTDMEKLVTSLTTKMEALEGRFFEVEKQTDFLKKELLSVKQENRELRDQLSAQEKRTHQVLSDLNDQQQYDRRWNLRVYNVTEEQGETADDCARKCCQIFSDLIGVTTTNADLEAAHRTGPVVRGKKRPIIVRFMSRKLKDCVLADRRKLKNKGVSVDEDLTPANYRLAREAYKHSYTLASWSSHGKVFAKLKNNKTVRLKYGDNVDDIFRKEMPVQL